MSRAWIPHWIHFRSAQHMVRGNYNMLLFISGYVEKHLVLNNYGDAIKLELQIKVM